MALDLRKRLGSYSPSSILWRQPWRLCYTHRLVASSSQKTATATATATAITRTTTRLCSSTRDFTTKQQGYQSIRSFHNDNLAELLAQDDKTYQAPLLPFEEEEETTTTTTTTTRLKTSSRNDFTLNLQDWTFLNHGAFGAALRVGQVRAEAWRRYAEEQPLRYHDRTLLPHLAHSARLLANYLVQGDNVKASSQSSSSSSSYALLPNVTNGINAVLSNYAQFYGNQGHVIFWDSTYGSVKSMARHYMTVATKHNRGKVTEIPLVAQNHVRQANTCRTDAVTQALLQHVGNLSSSMSHSDTTTAPPLVLLEHTTSNTALTWDLPATVRAVREHVHPHAWIVVDGAHGLWAQDTGSVLVKASSNDAGNNDNDATTTTSSSSSQIDIYVTNGHKWLAAPRGVALAWSRNTAATKTLLQWPAVLSHGMNADDLFSRFVWDGCRDYTASLAIPAVLEYWQAVGQDKNNKHNSNSNTVLRQQVCHDLWQGLAYLARIWHGFPEDASLLRQQGCAHGLLLASEEWLDAPMALLRLPPHWEPKNDGTHTSNDAKRIQDYLYSQNVEVPVKCIQGNLYVRVSYHVYNRFEDIERLGRVLQK